MRSNRFLGLIALLLLVLAAGPAGAQDADTAATAEELQVADMAFGSGYDYATRTLEGAGDTFPADTAVVWCRTRITGATEPTTVTHVWFREGKTMARVELNVGVGSYRTVSSKKLLPEWTGRWEVTVLDAAGTVLRSETFTVE